MKNLLFSLLVLMIIAACKEEEHPAKDYPVQPVPFTKVQLADHFWMPRLETNRKVTIPYDFKKCEETNRINNFAVAGKIQKGSFKGIRYNDSDVFKVMEAAAYSLATFPDAELEAYMDSLISLVAAAQEEDGYLYTARTINPDTLISNAGKKRWGFLEQSHELYNIGHMYEAAAAYYQSTGKRNFLDIALKSADLVCSVFGPEANQLHGVPGHQEIEIGLVKLFRITNNRKYLNMAKYFLDQRGDTIHRTPYTYNFGENKSIYTQDHLAAADQCNAVGHAVRAAYMYSAMTDIAALTGDEHYKKAVHTLWEDVVYTKTYITGGIGSLHSGEAFGEAYHLPNLSAYNETCAAIANMLWNQRMFLLTGEAKYIDVLERTLYNGFLSGVSFDGNTFFYPNPLESDGSHERAPWFNCSCCPTNVARFLPSLPGYIYAIQEDKIFINLFISSETDLITDQGKINISQKSDYPWKGNIEIIIDPEKEQNKTVAIRIPGWLSDAPIPGNLYSYTDSNEENLMVDVNGEKINFQMVNGFMEINKKWKSGDIIHVQFPLYPRKVKANERVKADQGRLALTFGPLTYCTEWVDNGGKARNLMIDENTTLKAEFNPEILNGLVTLKGKGYHVNLDKSDQFVKQTQELTLIPYYAWAHRGNGEMMVWLPYKTEASNPTPPPTIASQSQVSTSFIHDQITALNDQVLPIASADHEIPRFTFWNHKGTKEWVQYDFSEETTVAYFHVYWFDDGPEGGCRIPESWKAYYQENGQWKEVRKNGDYPVEKNAMNTIEIAPIKTKAVRLEIQLVDGFSGGILEWKIE